MCLQPILILAGVGQYTCSIIHACWMQMHMHANCPGLSWMPATKQFLQWTELWVCIQTDSVWLKICCTSECRMQLRCPVSSLPAKARTKWAKAELQFPFVLIGSQSDRLAKNNWSKKRFGSTVSYHAMNFVFAVRDRQNGKERIILQKGVLSKSCLIL